jgi:hypothetical protein
MKFGKTPVIISSFTAACYFCIAIFLLNPSLVIITLFSNSTLSDKLFLLLALLQSSWVALTHFDFSLLLVTSLLVGINVAVSFKLLQRVQKMGKVSVTFGSGTVVGVFSAGCASCGFSAFSLFGFSGTVALFPLHGSELYALAISLLLVSLYYNIKTLQKPLVCKTR